MSNLEIYVPHSDNPDQQKILFDKAVKKFKKLVEKEGIIKQVQDNRYYKKVSEIRRKEQKDRERHSRHANS